MNSIQKLKWWPGIGSQRVVFALLLALLIMVGMAAFVLASDVSDATWRGEITVTNNGTSATAVSVNMSLSSASLVENGYASADLTDIAIQLNGVDTAFMPSVNSTYPWAIWVPSIGAGQNVNYDLYSGGVTGGKLRYFSGAGGMTTPDSASLEPGDNFTIEQKGWVDTTAVGANLTSKDGTFRSFLSGSGNITSFLNFREDFLTYTEVDVPGNLTVTSSRATGVDVDRDESIYLYKDEGIDYFDDLDIDFEIYLNSNSLTNGLGGVALANLVGDMGDFGTTEIGVYIIKGDPNVLTLFRGKITAGDSYAAVVVDIPYYCTLERASGSDNATCKVYFDSTRETLLDTLIVTGYGTTKWRYVYGSISYNVPLAASDFDGYVQDLALKRGRVTATNVSSGEHTVTTTANVTHMWIDIDGSTEDTVDLSGAGVPDISANWTFLQNDVMPYMEYQDISVNGTQVQYIVWEYSTTFSDTSGYGNDATPTFRTSSSDADVSAVLATFEPVDEAKLDTFTLIDSYAILTENATLPAGTYDELDVSKIPGGAAANELLAEGDIPQAAWWFPFLFLGICVVGLIMYGATTLNRSGFRGRLAEGKVDGSLLMMFVIMEVPLVVFGIMGVIPKWPFMIFPIAGVAIIISRKHYSWG